MKILIADDHPIVRRGLREILSEEPGFQVVGEARNGQEVADMVRHAEWDLLVLDYSMPGRSGAELLKAIKRDYPRKPILVLSMFPEELYAKQVFRAGGSGYLNKECVGDELIAAVRKVVNGGKYVSPAFAEKLAAELTVESERPLHETLSDREYRVMGQLVAGKQVNDIARDMFLSPSTVSTYRARIFKKLRLANNAQLFHYAIKHQLVE